MPDSYLQFSEAIDDLTSKEKEWLAIEQMKIGGKYNLFESAFLPDARFWLYSEDTVDVMAAAEFVQNFLKKFRPNGVFRITYSITCSKPKISEFGGGAVVVTASKIETMDAQDWADMKVAAHHRRKSLIANRRHRENVKKVEQRRQELA